MDAQQVQAFLGRLTAKARAGLAAVVPTLRRWAAPLLGMWMRLTMARWERMQQFFATHRDLVEVDSWLDRWYSFGTA